MNETPRSPFIPAWLDDTGLSVSQFRVLSHIYRRGECTSSGATIASICRMKRDTVFKVLNELEAVGLIRRRPRPGQSTVIEAVPPIGTPPAASNRTGSSESSPQPGHHLPSKGGCPPSLQPGRPPSPEPGHKGSPCEGNPREGGESKSRSPFLEIVEAHLREAFPLSPSIIGRRERDDIATNASILQELTASDWLAVKAWNHATEKIRGRPLWPRHRGEFLDPAKLPEAIEKIRSWWNRKGRSWWGNQSEPRARPSPAARGAETADPSADAAGEDDFSMLRSFASELCKGRGEMSPEARIALGFARRESRQDQETKEAFR